MVFVTLLIAGHWLYTGRKPIVHPRDIDMGEESMRLPRHKIDRVMHTVSNVPGPEIDVDHNPPTSRLEKFL